jgi:hypothetical protein
MEKGKNLLHGNSPMVKALFVCLMLLSGCIQKTTPISSSYKTYSGEGISIHYPDNFTESISTELKPEENGLVGKLTTIYFKSPDLSIGIKIDLIEDPTRNINYPDSYPPSDFYLQICVTGEIGSINVTKSQVNEDASMEAVKNAVIATIDGQYAISYNVQLQDDRFGNIYLRGTEIVTEKREISIKLIGFSGVSENENVNSKYINDLWEKLVNSISISY